VVSQKCLIRALTAGALVAVLAGFGGAPTEVPEKKTPAVCKLLTTREAAKILGTDVNKGKEKKVTLPRPGAKAGQCEWASKEKGVGGIEGEPFKLQVETNTGTNVGSDYEKAKAGVDFEDLVTVPDLGKDAFYDDSPFSGVHILVADDKVLSVKVTNYNTAKADLPKPPAELSIDAAKIAVKRLTKT
jgi:hypothetical protein